MPTSGSSRRSRAIRCSATAAVQAERVAVAAHQPDLLVGADPPETASPRREQDEAGVAGQLGGAGVLDAAALVELVELLDGTSSSAMPVQPESTPCSARYSSASRPHADALTRIGRSLETIVTSQPSSARFLRHGEDAGVVVAQAESSRQRGGVGVVELDPQRAAVGADGDRPVESALADPQVVEQPQGLAGEVAELGMVAFALELRDDDDRQDDLVLGEPEHRARVGEQHRRVDHVGLALRRACARGRPRGRRGGVGRSVGRDRSLRSQFPLPDRRADRAPTRSRGAGRPPEGGIVPGPPS